MKTAVVTGASSGIGEATARELTRRGWRAVLVARRRERLEQLAAELDGEYEVADVSARADVEQAAAAILARHPQIDLLVNNAGIPGRGDFFSLEPERIEAVIRTNYLGCVWMVRALEGGLAPGSHVVNVVSVAGTVAFVSSWLLEDGTTFTPSTLSLIADLFPSNGQVLAPGDFTTISVESAPVATVPEPATATLLLVAGAAAFIRRRLTT